MVGFSSTGSRMGNVFAFAIGGFLCVDGFAGGWPSIFYTFGNKKNFILINRPTQESNYYYNKKNRWTWYNLDCGIFRTNIQCPVRTPVYLAKRGGLYLVNNPEINRNQDRYTISKNRDSNTYFHIVI